MRQRGVLFLIGVALLGVSVGEVKGAEKQSIPPNVTVEVEGKAGRENVPVVPGSSCWRQRDGQTSCDDTFGPFELIKNQTPVVTPPESRVIIIFERTPLTMSASKWINGRPVKQEITKDNTFVLPPDKGVYIYDVFATWKEGDASYAFVIEVR